MTDEIDFGNGISIRPPEPGDSPEISGTDALNNELGDNPFGLSATAVLGLMTDENMRPIDDEGNKEPLTYEDELVWLVTIDGYCLPGQGAPPQDSPECIFHGFIDAGTGKELIGF